MDDILTVTQAAKYKGLSTGYLRKLCIDGKLEGAQKLGSVWIIPRLSLDNYVPAPRGFAAVWKNRRNQEKQALMQAFIDSAKEI